MEDLMELLEMFNNEREDACIYADKRGVRVKGTNAMLGALLSEIVRSLLVKGKWSKDDILYAVNLGLKEEKELEKETLKSMKDFLKDMLKEMEKDEE